MADAEPPAAAGKKKSSLMGTIVEWLVVTIIAAGAGAALTFMNPQPLTPDKTGADKPPPGKLASEKKEGEKVEVAANCSPGPSLVDMPPIVTNIANPPDIWVRLEASIIFNPKTEPHPEIVAAEIATDELAYLHTVSVGELQGPIGLENLRQDLRDRAQIRSNGKVTELLLKTLVLQ